MEDLKIKEKLDKNINNKSNIPFLEPLFEFRFSIDFFDKKSNKIDFYEQSVRNFKLSSVKIDNRTLKYKNFLNLKMDLINYIGHLINPEQIFNIDKINFLDPTGIVVDYYLMKIDLDNFELCGNYGNSELSTYKLSFFVSVLETQKDETIKNN